MKKIDIEEKMTENKSKLKEIGLFSLGGILIVGFIIGLTLTLVFKDKDRVISADEIKSTFDYQVALKNTKSFDYEIKNLGIASDSEEFKDKKYFANELTLKGELFDESSNTSYYVSKYDDEEESKIVTDNEVKLAFKKVTESFYFHTIKTSLGDGLLFVTYDTNNLLVDKKENDDYLLFNQYGILIEGYKEGSFSINKGKFFQE